MSDIAYMTSTYYSKDVNNNIIQWSAMVINGFEQSGIIITTGRIGNTREIKSSLPQSKNISKSNQTSRQEQAIKEIKAKEKIKIKNGYKTLEMLGLDTMDKQNMSLESLLQSGLKINKTDHNNNLKPMKAVKFKPNSMNYPCLCDPKINGLRSVYMLVDKLIGDGGMFDKNITIQALLSKEGHEYILPHISEAITINIFKQYNISFDGELYVHREILSNIRRRLSMDKGSGASKNSLSSDPVKLYIFDLSVPDMSQRDRRDLKNQILLNQANVLYYNSSTKTYNVDTLFVTPLVNVQSCIINSDGEAYERLEAALKCGYEGIVLRDMDAEYGFGQRRNNMMKLKKSMSGEFKVIDVIKKNEDSTRTYITFVLQNDTNDKTFECTPEGNEIQRREFLSNKWYYIGKLMTATYYERTITDLPFHAVGRIRDSFDMNINDLNKED